MREIALAIDSGGANGQINAPGGAPSGGLDVVGAVLRNGLTILLILTVALSLIFIIWSGVQWSTSGGDKNKLTTARSRLTWAILGLIIALLAYAIVGAVGYFFQIDLTSFKWQ